MERGGPHRPQFSSPPSPGKEEYGSGTAMLKDEATEVTHSYSDISQVCRGPLLCSRNKEVRGAPGQQTLMQRTHRSEKRATQVNSFLARKLSDNFYVVLSTPHFLRL